MTSIDSSREEPLQAEVYDWSSHARMAAWVILIFGAVLRIARFVHFRSLWLDEIYLANSIIPRDLHDLLFKPLEDWQAAPVGYLLLAKLSVSIFGAGERALRLPALLFNLASLPLFYGVARRMLSQGAGIIALIFFAILGPLVYYASEVKQYSCDVAVTLAILLAIMRWLKNRDGRRLVVLAATGAIGIFFSHPAIFTLIGAAVVGTLILRCDRDAKNLRPLLIAIGIWIVAFAINYFLFIRPLADGEAHPHLVKYWWDRDAFMPIAPWWMLSWLFNRFYSICQNPGAMWLIFPGTSMVAIFLGLFDLFRRRRQFLVLLVAGIVVTLLASAARQYPFGDRLILFIVPTLILLIAAGIDFLRRNTTCGIAGWVVFGMLLMPSLTRACGYLIHSPGREETLQSYEWITRHWQAGDTIYLSHFGKESFEFYHGRAGLNLETAIVQPNYEDDPRGYIEDVKQLAGKKRVWVVLVHTLNGHGQDESVFTKMGFDSIGVQESALHHREEGVEVLLYDCSTAPPPPAKP